MAMHAVKIDGEVVWSQEIAEEDGGGFVKAFPAEYRARPDEGEVYLIIDDEIVAVQQSVVVEELAAIEAQAARDEAAGEYVGEAHITLDDNGSN